MGGSGGLVLLSVYTPTFRRPGLLEQCKESVAGQTVPVEHVIVEDKVGIGIDGMYGQIRHHAHKVTGDYVMVLSDDNILIDPNVAAELARFITENDGPDVVVWKGDICGATQPVAWDCEPQVTKIDLSCFAVRRDLWVEYADRWGERYEGDWDFIHAVWEGGHRFAWWDRVAFKALRISHGEPE